MSDPSSVENEDTLFEERVAQIDGWFKQPRFKNVMRPYHAATVASKQGSLEIQYPSSQQAKKLWELLSKHAAEGTPALTMGAIDPVQMTQMAPHLDLLYVSGWACSSVLASS